MRPTEDLCMMLMNSQWASSVHVVCVCLWPSLLVCCSANILVAVCETFIVYIVRMNGAEYKLANDVISFSLCVYYYRVALLVFIFKKHQNILFYFIHAVKRAIIHYSIPIFNCFFFLFRSFSFWGFLKAWN